jgi:aldose sugar dehydrogenase
LAVANQDERGLLGIALDKTHNGGPVTYAYLYLTESRGGKDGDDANGGVEPAGNRLYRFELQHDDGNSTKVRLVMEKWSSIFL